MNRAFLVAFLLVTLPSPALAEVGDVDQPQICYTCHDAVQGQQQAAHVHTAFAEGTCSNCHNPHASKHAALLSEEASGLCAGCHAELSARAALAVPHAPARRGDCTACHDPHASAQPGQLRLPLVEQCTVCHAAVANWMSRPVVHAPVAGADCTTCHDPHGSDFAALLPAETRETCLGCHDADAAMTAAHGSEAIAGSDCTACHDPHSSGRRGLLRANEHGPFASGSCDTCHGEMSGRSDFAVTGIRETCERCHVATRQFAEFPYKHNLDAPGSCVQCHNPHASNFAALLLRSTADVCQGCHFDEPDRAKPQAAYVTHDAMDCTECHMPHGSTDARYLRSTGPELCAGCHESAHQVSHPVGPEIIDPRTAEPVTCLSCHQLHGADFDQYIPLDPTRELCLQCHRR